MHNSWFPGAGLAVGRGCRVRVAEPDGSFLAEAGAPGISRLRPASRPVVRYRRSALRGAVIDRTGRGGFNVVFLVRPADDLPHRGSVGVARLNLPCVSRAHRPADDRQSVRLGRNQCHGRYTPVAAFSVSSSSTASSGAAASWRASSCVPSAIGMGWRLDSPTRRSVWRLCRLIWSVLLHLPTARSALGKMGYLSCRGFGSCIFPPQ